MTASNVLQWVLWIAGTIILGAFGSGLWDTLFKPWSQSLARAALNLLTFGRSRLRDTLYLDAAKGRHERAAFWLVRLTIFLGFGLIGGSVGYVFTSEDRDLTPRIEASKDALESFALTHRLESLTPAERADLQARMKVSKDATDEFDRKHPHASEELAKTKNFVEQAGKIVVVLTALIFAMEALRAFRIDVVNTITSDFDQALAICRPYLEQKEEWAIRSRFASMTSRDDYMALMKELRKTAVTNKVRMPTTSYG